MKARSLWLGSLLTALMGLGFLLLIRSRNLTVPSEETANQTLEWFIVGAPAIPCIAFGLAAYFLSRERRHLVTVAFALAFALLAHLSTETRWAVPSRLWPLDYHWRDLVMTAYFVLLAASAPLGAWLGWWFGRRGLRRAA